VRGGKRDKDRRTLLPEGVVQPLRGDLEGVRKLYEEDRANDLAGVSLPKALERKYPNAGKEWGWFWVFPSPQLSIDPRTRVVRRHHVSPIPLQRIVRKAAQAAGIPKHITVHTLGIHSPRT